MTKRWGATPEEWAALKRLAKVDLLPVVSNPHAEISPSSRMKALGKTPSVFNHKRQVIGFADWTEHETTVRNLEAWAEEPDFGACVQTRRIRALDIDVPDQDLADEIAVRFAELLEVGEDDPTPMGLRTRADSGKRLLAFICPEPLTKRAFVVKEWQEWDEARGRDVTKRWLVELLADGQQFVAAGTHTGGARYEWGDGIPKALPSYSLNRLDRAWRVLVKEFALPESERRSERRDPTLIEDLDVDDPVAEFLVESEWPTYGLHKGMLYLDCPWKDGHSSDNGETETAWLLAGTGKYRNGHFACRHAGCSDHTDADFFTAVGYRPVAAEEFDDLTVDDVAEVYTALAPGASAKSKELKAAARLPLPGFNRDNMGRIETSLENLRRALGSVQAAECEIAYDTFRGELMYAEQPGEWQPMTDAYQVKLRARLHNLGFKDEPGKEKMRDALEWVGNDNQFDSAQLWLGEVVPAWDGVARIADFFPRYMRTERSPYTRACGNYLWTALAGRILEPGVKADMVPVLVGAQGARKSSGIAAIAPAEEFFSEFDLEARDDDKARKMRGCLVGELAELRGLQTRDRESILAWIARRHEEWTPKYKEHKVQLARRCVFLGSTNDDEFLDDPTGERRWLPLTVHGVIDTDAIARDRLQLWAEGREVFLHDGGVAYEAAERLARGEHHKFKVADDWLPRVAGWLDSPWSNLDNEDETPRNSGRLLANDVLTECLGLQKVTKRDQMRVAGILKKLGMEKVLKRVTTSRNEVDTGTSPPAKVWVDPRENDENVTTS